MKIIIACKPKRSTSGPAATSPTAAPRTAKIMRRLIRSTRSRLVRASSGINASKGPLVTVVKMLYMAIVAKRKTAMVAVEAFAGGSTTSTANRAARGVPTRMNGSRRPSRDRVRSLQ